MRLHRSAICLAALIATAFVTHETSAQNFQLPSTVQLPTFNFFTYSGSVLVPTGGSTSLGGVSRSASGRTSRRFGGRAHGSTFGHGAASAHVTIIDHDAIDREIRGLPPKRIAAPTGTAARKGASSGRSMVSRAETSPKPSRTSLDVNDPDAEGKALVRFARKQFLAGKRGSSFDAYQLAIDSLSPRLAGLAKAEFRRVFPSEQRPAKFQVQDARVAGN